MTELQKKSMEMLDWFHNFCVENNLRYYMIGGTMLGAARHKGFIPWDDDIDVGMPREDYEKLENIMGNKIHGKYFLETPNTEAEDFWYPYSKLYDTTTTLVENFKFKLTRGIFLDVFPLDGIGNSFDESKKNYAPIHRKKLLLLARIIPRKKRSFKKKIIIFLVNLLPSKFFNNKKLRQKIVKNCKKYSFNTFAYGGNLVGAWGVKEIMPLEQFGTPILYEFEGRKVYGVEKFDEYLTSLYGDWRKLPPEEKQVSHHGYLSIDLNKSYLEN